LIRLETWVREAFVKKQHLVAVFFDINKAYDSAWKYGILKALHGMGLRGHLYQTSSPISSLIEGSRSESVVRSLIGSTKKWEFHRVAS
jgi:hypothetical protein